MSVVGMVQRNNDAIELFRRADYRGLLEKLEAVVVPAGTYQCEYEQALLPVLLTKYEKIVAQFKRASYLTVGLVIASVAMLMVAEPISANFNLTMLVFFAGFVWFSACLVAFVVLVNESLR